MSGVGGVGGDGGDGGDGGGGNGARDGARSRPCATRASLQARARGTHAETSKVIAEPGTAHCSLVLRSFNGSISELSTVADADASSSDAAAAQRQERPMFVGTDGERGSLAVSQDVDEIEALTSRGPVL